jgi:hypothetical protein
MLFQTPLTNARIEGDHVRFQFIFQEPNRQTSLSFDLTLIDGHLHGLVTGTADGLAVKRTVDFLRIAR